MTKQEYQELIRAFAEDIFNSHIKAYKKEYPDADFNECESALQLRRELHEYVGGSEYTFKWKKSLEVLAVSDRVSKHIYKNPQKFTSYDKAIEYLAYHCMYDDLYEQLQEVCLERGV